MVMLYIHPKRSRGAFLIIALILLIVLSALGVASMTLAITSNRVSRNYSEFLEAKTKATSMANYGKRILETYTSRVYPLPATCDSTGTCNVINNDYPFNGRPTLVWADNLDTENLVKTAGSDAWWTDNGFAYEESFAGGGNARVIVSLLGTDPIEPWRNNYRIVGYATDNTGQVRATTELFHSIEGYMPDPYPGDCTGGCNYGECCSSASACVTTQDGCEGGSAAYVPPGWTCQEYFVTGLGYDAATCNNPTAYLLSIWHLAERDKPIVEDYIDANAEIPAPGSFVMTGASTVYQTGGYATFDWEGENGLSADIQEENIPGNLMPTPLQHEIFLKPYPRVGNDGYYWTCTVLLPATTPFLPFDCDDLTPPHYLNP